MKEFIFKSKSGGADHMTRAYDDGRVTCSCRGFNTPNHCWHYRSVMEQMQGGSAPTPEPIIADFIKPMLASPLTDGFTVFPGVWAATEKIDGHRLVVRVNAGPCDVTAWSRYGKVRDLPSHILTALSSFPACVLDGELMTPGGQSHNVTELTQSGKLIYAVFDVLELLGRSTMNDVYDSRQAYLTEIFTRLDMSAVTLIESRNVQSDAEVTAFTNDVWARGGEGLILKRRTAVYQSGKRSKDFLKIKKLQSATLTIIGFEASKGAIMGRGAHAVVLLRDDDGNETSVKTLDDATLAHFDANPLSFIGRRLVIEYQERIGKSYRHPRFDHLEEA